MAPAVAEYIAPRLPVGSPPLRIDGDLRKEEWSRAAWSSLFTEIRGVDAPAHARPPASCGTRVKMLWDEEFLYVGAELHSSAEVVASFTARNEPIFQRDSDFEVFVDPAGSCAWYKEVEINALNAVWNLMLSRPYMDGGDEYSGRIASPGEPRFYDARAQLSATRLLRGKLNDPAGASWAVELALAHSDTLAHVSGVPPPAVGHRWRINFSRVEQRGEINWVWTPQCVWEPTKKRCLTRTPPQNIPRLKHLKPAAS